MQKQKVREGCPRVLKAGRTAQQVWVARALVNPSAAALQTSGIPVSAQSAPVLGNPITRDAVAGRHLLSEMRY